MSVNLSDTFKTQMKQKKHSFYMTMKQKKHSFCMTISRREKDGYLISCMVYLIMVDMSLS